MLLFLLAGVGQVWGEEVEIVSTFAKEKNESPTASFTASNTGTNNVYSTGTTFTITSKENNVWALAPSTSGSIYFSMNNSEGGFHLGSKNYDAGDATLTSSTSFLNVTQIKISGKTGKNGSVTISVKVGNTSISLKQGSSATFSGSTVATATFISASPISGTVEVTMTDGASNIAYYIESITITTSTGIPESTVKNVQFSPDGGDFVGSQSVTLSQEDNKDIYYTTDADAGADDPSTESPWIVYSGAINLNATTTIYAAAKDGDDWSSVTSKTFTKIEPLATMEAVQGAVPASGTTNINVIITDWVVTGVSNNQVWIADATNEKGILLFKSSHGFNVGDKLNGTVLGTGLTKYNDFAELNSLTKSQVTVTTADAITPRVTTIAALTSGHPTEQGTIVKLENLTYNGSSFSDGTKTITIDTRFYNPTLESNHNYNLSGVVFYGSSKTIKIMPRSADDIEEIVPAGAPEFTPASKKFVGSIDVELSQENNLPIYYTDNASLKDNPSISTWTSYENAIHVETTKTIYAAALDGEEWSDVNVATYTLANPLTTMAAVQGAATSTETGIDITITNWVVTAVDNIGTGDNKRVWIVDADNAKGILLYDNTANHGFVVGKKLNGTVLDTKIKTYQGYAELTSLKAADVDVTDAEAIAARTTTIAALGTGRPAEQGTIVKLENVTYNGTAFSDGENTIEIDTRLSTPTLTSGKRYNLTGVVFYSSATAIKLMPRSNEDIEPLADKVLSSISISGTHPIVFEQGDEFSHEGIVVKAHYEGAADEIVTASATFSGYDMSATGEQTVTVSYTENEVEKTATYGITVNAPASTGDFELLEGELVAGDYLVYYDGNILLAGETDSRLNYADEITPDDGVISNPSKLAIWTFAKSGDYWTLYNAKTAMYAASTGAKNKAQLLADGTDDKSLWTISDGYEIVNKQNTTNEVNANLRFNSGYGFACYSTSTGGALSLYKKAAPSYSISATLTGCTADAENAKKVPQALDDDVVLKYNLTTGFVWPDAITVEVGGVELDADEVDYLWDNTKVPAELTIAKAKVTGNIAITITATEKSLKNITIAQAPTKVAYETGEFFNPAGLKIQLNYTAGDPDVVVYNDETKDAFAFSPNLTTALETTDEKVEITYADKSVDQTITVTDPVATNKTVVIIAEYNSKLYAMSNVVSSSACAAIEVTKDGDDLVVASEENKAAVQWFMSKLGSNVKLQVANNEGQYLSAGSSAALSLVDDEVSWDYSVADGKYLISKDATRAIMYQSSGSTFKHYATSNTEGYARVSEIFEVADEAANIKVVVPVVHEFVVDPDEDVAFGTVEQNETVSPKSFNVTLTNIASATVTLSDDAAFSIDKSSLDADGTITITPNTANVDNFSATITLHDGEGVAEDKVINVTMKVVAPRDCDRTDDFSTVNANNSYDDRKSVDGWSAVYTAVVVKDEVTYWMINGRTDQLGIITSPEFNYGIKQLSFDYYYSYNESHGISFKVEIKKDGSVVKTETITKTDAAKNTVYSATIEDINVEGKYQIVFTNLSPSNSNSNADRFAIGNLCWKKYGEPVYETVRSGLETNRYYTVCLNGSVSEVRGASFWKIEYRDNAGKEVYLEEVDPTTFDAGTPFIIQATAAALEVVYDGKATTEAGTNGALRGTLEDLDKTAFAALTGNIYLLINNAIRPRTTGNYLNANRAYIDYDALTAVSSTPQGAPGKRVRSMPMQTQVATGVDELNASETPVKVMIDGQLFILRGEKMYNANGQLVK